MEREDRQRADGILEQRADAGGRGGIIPVCAGGDRGVSQTHRHRAPADGRAGGWKFIERPAGAGYPQVFAFPQPEQTRGLRVLPEKPVGSIAYALGGPVVMLAALGEQAEPPTLRVPPAPYTFSYTMPMSGFIAVNILEKGTGKIVRRLIAETARDKGTIAEPWDLQDDAKQFVPPGEYAWTAVACPPLTLTYQTTVNNAGHPPWWAPVRGGGGWMADHSPPVSVGTIGGKVMLFGSTVCEKGQSGIATDLEGNKLWGESPVLTSWGGAYRIASDGRYGYLINHYGIEQVDPAQPSFNPTEVLKFAFTREVPGGQFGGADLGGPACGNKLYVAFHALPVPWITSAPQAEDFALMQCLPLVRKTHEYQEAEYDDITRFYSTFLVGSPNDRTQSSFGDAPTGRCALRHPHGSLHETDHHRHGAGARWAL